MQKDYLLKLLTINASRLAKTHLRGNYKSAYKGQGIVMSNSRAYVPGDSIRSIDRRTTAKKGELYVKEFEEEKQIQVLFAVDVAKSMDFTTTWISKLDITKQIVSFVWYVAQQQSNKVGGITFGQNVCHTIRPSQQQAMLYQLQQYVETSCDDSISDIQGALQTIKTMNSKHAVLIVIADEFIPETLYPQLAWLSQIHELLRIQCIDPFEKTLDASSIAGVKLTDMQTTRQTLLQEKTREDYKQAFIDHQQQMETFLGSIGADFVQIHTDEDPLVRLAHHFQEKAKRMQR